MVVEGDQAKRQWQWQLPDVPLRIANYELLLRDRQLLAGLHFDLVVLDESQRIKNRDSSTNEVVCSISRKRNWALTGTPVENSADDLLGYFRLPRTGFPLARDEAAGHRANDRRPRSSPHEGSGAPRFAAQAAPRRAARPDARTTRELPAGRRGGHRAADRNGRRGHDSTRLRVGLAAETDLQLRSAHRGQHEARTHRSRSGRNRPKRPESDHFQPVGRHAEEARRSVGRVLARWSITARFPPRGATP